MDPAPAPAAAHAGRSTLNKPAIAINDNLWCLISVREFTGDGFKDVQRRDQPLHHAKFISYDDEAAARPTQDPEQIYRVQRFRNDNCRGGRSQRRDVFPDSRATSISFARTIPMISSSSPRQTGKRLCGDDSS